MRLLALLLTFLFLVGIAYAGDSTYTVPYADIHTAHWRDIVGDRLMSYGDCSDFWVGYHNEFLNNSHQRLSFATIHLADSLIGDGTTNLDSVKIKFYVRAMTVDSVHQFWFRLDSTKIAVEGYSCHANEDCGTNWLRHREGAGGDPQCEDLNWSTGGGDYYGDDTLFVTHVTGTGWHTWVATSSDGLLSYFENIIDSNSTLDTQRFVGTDGVIGGLILIQDSTGDSNIGTEVQFMSEDTTVFRPEITFYGNWSRPEAEEEENPPRYVHEYDWVWMAHGRRLHEER